MADAREQVRFVVGERPGEEIDRLAAAYVRRSIWRGESRWHPDLATAQKVEGLEALRELQQAGTGVVVNIAHHGDYECIPPALARHGVPIHAVATSEMFTPDAPLWMKQQARLITSHPGARLVDVSAGTEGISALLAEGKSVLLASDQPGRTPVHFLGHDLVLSSGAARIATALDVPVVVATSRPDPEDPDGCAVLVLDPPLRPGDFGSPDELLQALLTRHEEAFLAWPEASEHPLRMLDQDLVKRPGTRREAG